MGEAAATLPMRKTDDVSRRADRRARRLLHVFASFGLGGVPIRICDVANRLPPGFRHTVVALDGCDAARRRLAPHVEAEFRSLRLSRYDLPGSLLRVRRLLRAVSPDLLLTYNWGAVECALANRFAPLCPHIHFESGFGVEEGDGRLWRRNLFRRLALGRVRRLVVPSETLEEIAVRSWGVPPARLLRIPNGVDLARYRGEPGRRAPLPALGAGDWQTVIGTVAPLRPEKNVGRLLHAFAALPASERCALVIAGDGPEMGRLRGLAADLGIAERTFFLGHVEDVPAVLRALDVFALSSDTEQMPNSLLQAMAAARPVVAVDVGDVRRILAGDNRPLVVPRDAPGALTRALAELAADAPRRARLGQLNRARAERHYSLEGMVAAYRDLLAAP